MPQYACSGRRSGPQGRKSDQKTVLAKTATSGSTPAQAETVAKAQGMGQISLALRPFAEDAAITAAARSGGRQEMRR